MNIMSYIKHSMLYYCSAIFSMQQAISDPQVLRALERNTFQQYTESLRNQQAKSALERLNNPSAQSQSHATNVSEQYNSVAQVFLPQQPQSLINNNTIQSQSQNRISTTSGQYNQQTSNATTRINNQPQSSVQSQSYATNTSEQHNTRPMLLSQSAQLSNNRYLTPNAVPAAREDYIVDNAPRTPNGALDTTGMQVQSAVDTDQVILQMDRADNGTQTDALPQQDLLCCCRYTNKRFAIVATVLLAIGMLCVVVIFPWITGGKFADAMNDFWVHFHWLQ